MNIENLHNTLNNKLPNELKRAELIKYLKERLINIPAENEMRKKLAYEIASLLSTDYSKTLKDSVIDDILTLAGELEVENNEKDWQELHKLILSL